MKDLYTVIVEEGCEDITVGESIINTFICGNFNSGTKKLIKINIRPREFGEYLFDHVEEMGFNNICEYCNNFFDYDFFISLERDYSRIYEEVNND